MKVKAIFDIVSPEYEIEVPDGLSDGEIEDAVYGWLDNNLEEVKADIMDSEIWVSGIEEEA